MNIYRPGCKGSVQKPPPEFEEEFIAGGWRRVERLYGRRMIRKWIALCGGAELLRKRREKMKGAEHAQS